MACYNTCPDCGSNLDIGERCDCNKTNKPLIVVEQLPIITARLKEIKLQVAQKTQTAASLAVTKENKQQAKSLRSELNKELEQLESLRKQVKNSVLEPYNQFEDLYKTEIKALYETADNTLKEKILSIDNAEIFQKEIAAKEYFTEYLQSLEIEIADFLSFEKLDLKINLTVSLAGLKKQIQEYLDKVLQEYTAIAPMEHSAEIYAEYLETFNFAQAVATVNERHKRIEKAQEFVPTKQVPIQEPAQEPLKDNPQKNIEQQPLQAPVIDEVLTLSFKVTAPKSKLKELKQFLISGGYDYGNI